MPTALLVTLFCFLLVGPGPATALTLTDALAQAARHRPELAALEIEGVAAARKLLHATLPPNPEVGFEIDNLGGTLANDEVREATLSLRQPIEIGGKKAARHKRGQAERQRLERERLTTWLEIAAEVRLAFLEVLAARERLALQEEAEQLTLDLAALTHERVASGALAATEESRAEARKAEGGVETQKMARLLAEAELNLDLALMTPAPTPVEGSLSEEFALPERQTLLLALAESPLLALRRDESELAQAALTLEEANAWSDPTLSLAVRESPGNDGRALLVGLALPLPLFQRNQLAVAEATATALKASRNEHGTALRQRGELIRTHTLLVAADREARLLRAEVLSRAREAEQEVREGFRFGKFRYSDVLEASQFLLTVRSRHLETIIELNRAAIALDRLLGKPALPEIAAANSSAAANRSN